MNNRRDFLKLASLAGIGLLGHNSLHGAESENKRDSALKHIKKVSEKPYRQIFNMSGYRAPKINTVRIGFIGLGRGMAHFKSATKLEGVDIKAVCDLVPEKINRAMDMLEGTGHNPDIFTDDVNAWKRLCERDDLDLIYVSTPWDMHVEVALYAMEQGKHVGIEVPAATTVEECRQLVTTSEQTRKHCVILENCCYDFFELLTLNMARQGFFGEVMHCEGAYIHDLLDNITRKNFKWNMWRLRENISRNGNLYPTHGLGPVCQIMNINRGDKMDYLVSMSTNDFMLSPRLNEMKAEDSFYRQFTADNPRGNMNTTLIRTNKGKTIMLQHDVSSPRPYSRIHLVSGTKATAQKYPLPGKIATSHKGWLSEEELKPLEERYQPEIIKRIGEMARQVGGHGGMDFLMNWRLIDCLRNGLPVDMDVYDTAAWSIIGPLSEWSVANRSSAIDIPDFTAGSWRTNTPVDIALKEGGTTGIRL
jgi:hypothetical protein